MGKNYTAKGHAVLQRKAFRLLDPDCTRGSTMVLRKRPRRINHEYFFTVWPVLIAVKDKRHPSRPKMNSIHPAERNSHSHTTPSFAAWNQDHLQLPRCSGRSRCWECPRAVTASCWWRFPLLAAAASLLAVCTTPCWRGGCQGRRGHLSGGRGRVRDS